MRDQVPRRAAQYLLTRGMEARKGRDAESRHGIQGARQAALKRSVGGRRQPGAAQPAAPNFFTSGQNGCKEKRNHLPRGKLSASLLVRGRTLELGRSGRNAGGVAAAPAVLAARVLVGGRSSSGGRGLRPDRNRTDTVGRQQEFAREQVHLDLAALTTAVIDDTVEADRRGFGGAGRIDVRDLASNRRRLRHARFHARR